MKEGIKSFNMKLKLLLKSKPLESRQAFKYSMFNINIKEHPTV